MSAKRENAAPSRPPSDVPAVIVYARQSVSDGDDEGERENTLSLQSQRATLERWATEQGWHIAAIITDADQKGWNDQRPGFLELLRRCRAGGVSHVAVWSLDRLARSVRITENVLHELSALGVEVVSYKEPWVGQPMFRQIIAAFGEEQTRTISAHIRRAMAERARRGLPHSWPPWGYVRPEPGAPYLIDTEHPERPPAIARMFARRVEGWSYTAIAKELTADAIPTPTGLTRWRSETVKWVLRNPAYRGAVAASGYVTEGAHPAIVTPEVWLWAQTPSRLYQRASREKRAASWLEGQVRHICGQPMYLIQAYGRSPHQFRCRMASIGCDGVGSPPCPHSPRAMTRDRAELLAWHEIVATLDALLPLPRVIATAHRQHRQSQRGADRERPDLIRRVDRITERRANAEELFLSSMRDRAWFDVQDARFAADLAVAEAELARLPAPPDGDRIAQTWATIATTRERVVLPDRGAVLAELGTIVVMPGGPALGRGQAGWVRLALKPDLVPFFRPRATP